MNTLMRGIFLKRAIWLCAVQCAALLVAIGGCDTDSGSPDRDAVDMGTERPRNPIGIPVQQAAVESASICFRDVTPESGVSFRWSGGPTAHSCMPEQNGGGVAILDFDHDGISDLALTDCGSFGTVMSSKVPAVHLFRGVGGFRFLPVSGAARLSHEACATGIAAGDFDADGFKDLLIAGFGHNQLFRNCGDGTFDDVPLSSGDSGETWSTSVAFADLNADGYLDAYIVNYVDWTPAAGACRNPTYPELIQICSPTLFNSQADQLLINGGDGTYRDAGADSGISLVNAGNGLALEIADFTGDGLLDVFVANDAGMNNMFRNDGAARFVDVGVSTGVAVSSDGAYGASMGIACGDYNRDGELDLFVTNFRSQVNDLYSGFGEGGFIHTNGSTGLDILSRHRLAFGAVMNDFDLDGWPDLFVANGHIWDLTSIDPTLEYEMPCDILRNVEGRVFQDVSRTAGRWFSQKFLARAVAAGDLDNDGLVDLVIQNVGAPAVVLANCSRRTGASRSVRFIGTVSSREPLGCGVEVLFEDGTVWKTHIPAGGSFQASHDARLVVPLGDSTIDRISIAWPDGEVEHWQGPFSAGEIVLIQGVRHAGVQELGTR
jgi:hypothetical protein